MGAACAMLQSTLGDDSCVAFEPDELLRAMVDADDDSSTDTIDENAFLRLMAHKVGKRAPLPSPLISAATTLMLFVRVHQSP